MAELTRRTWFGSLLAAVGLAKSAPLTFQGVPLEPAEEYDPAELQAMYEKCQAGADEPDLVAVGFRSSTLVWCRDTVAEGDWVFQVYPGSEEVRKPDMQRFAKEPFHEVWEEYAGDGREVGIAKRKTYNPGEPFTMLVI